MGLRENTIRALSDLARLPFTGRAAGTFNPNFRNEPSMYDMGNGLSLDCGPDEVYTITAWNSAGHSMAQARSYDELDEAFELADAALKAGYVYAEVKGPRQDAPIYTVGTKP